MDAVKQAVFYLTYNGIVSNTNGIGTQAKTFLAGLTTYYPALTKAFGDFDVHVITQIPYAGNWGYSATDRQYAEDTVAQLGGRVHYCPYRTADYELWTPAGWQAASLTASAIVLEAAIHYDRILVVANDLPFLHTPLYLELAKPMVGRPNCHIQSLIALYTSAYVHTRHAVDLERVAWEQVGLTTARHHPDVKLARYGEFMHRHFIEHYGADAFQSVPYTSSLLLEHSDFKPMPPEQVQSILVSNHIPLDEPLIFAFGRADWVKGFDILLKEMAAVNDQAHLVLNVVPYAPDAPILNEYRELIEANGLAASLLVGYSRELPRALCQWTNTRAVVCPSRGEPLSNIPFEVALWANNQGPVIVCAALDGYLEQIEDGRDGFLFDPTEPGDLERVLTQVLVLTSAQRATFRQAAYRKVIRQRDWRANFKEMLGCFWRARND